MSKLVTENNKPNRKVWAGAITGAIVTVALIVGPLLGVELPAEEVLREKAELITAGITAVIFIVQYLTRPGSGDGVKEDK